MASCFIVESTTHVQFTGNSNACLMQKRYGTVSSLTCSGIYVKNNVHAAGFAAALALLMLTPLRFLIEDSNSRFESILIDSFCKKNRPFDSLVVMQFLH